MSEIEMIELGELKAYYRGIELVITPDVDVSSKRDIDNWIVAHIKKHHKEPKRCYVTGECYAELWQLNMIDKSYY